MHADIFSLVIRSINVFAVTTATFSWCPGLVWRAAGRDEGDKGSEGSEGDEGSEGGTAHAPPAPSGSFGAAVGSVQTPRQPISAESAPPGSQSTQNSCLLPTR